MGKELGMSRLIIALALALFWSAGSAVAQDMRALARFDPALSAARETGASVEIEFGLSQGVPWTVSFRRDPHEMVISFNELQPAEAWDPAIQPLGASRFEAGEDGWSDLVFPLREPLRVVEAAMVTRFGDTSHAMLRLVLAPTTAEQFHETALDHGARPVPAPASLTARRFTVAIDPGHGGIDPGAEVGELRESDLMLTYARALKEALLRSGQVDVVLTREEDVFVPLDQRLRTARMADASVLISLHADALNEEDGKAGGATIYMLPRDGEDAANLAEVERHDASQLLSGVDLSGTEDEVALILLELARKETVPKSDRLAYSVENVFRENGVRLNSRARRKAGFAVLRAADIPAVLVEIGFLSSDRDRKRLTSDEGREAVIAALAEAILYWVADETERAALSRP